MSEQRITLPVPLPADAPAAIYVHIPFCSHVCPYCDFNTYSGKDDLIPAYIDAVVEEIELTSRMIKSNGPAPSLFIGGGTPSLVPASDIGRIVDTCRNYLELSAEAEITLEANPESLDVEYLTALRLAGVNRLSIGIQSQQRAGLRVLGRGHKSLQAHEAYIAARSAGFDNISLDFIFGWPGQSLQDWIDDLEIMLDWQPEHLSLYSLIIEDETPMQVAVRQQILTPVDDDTVADYYLESERRLSDACWSHYEIANWARKPGFRSVHNQYYWQNGSYYGIGAGAHSYLAGLRGSNILTPEHYIDAVRQGRRPIIHAESIDSRTAAAETMMLGLRLLQDGVILRDFHNRHGFSLLDVYGDRMRQYESLELMTVDENTVRLTPAGALVSNALLAEFLDD